MLRKKFNVLDDAEDILEDRLDVIDGKKIYKGIRLEKEFMRILGDNNGKKDVMKKSVKNIVNGEGIVYMIKSKNTKMVYIGSTMNDLGRRLDGHKCSYYKYDKFRSGYCSSYEVMKYGDYEIVEIYRYKCVDKKELEVKESEVIMGYGDLCVNVKDPKSGKSLRVDNGMTKRKKERVARLYELGKDRLDLVSGMSEEELRMLKMDILKEIEIKIEEYRRGQDWYEYWRLGKIDDNIFDDDDD